MAMACNHSSVAVDTCKDGDAPLAVVVSQATRDIDMTHLKVCFLYNNTAISSFLEYLLIKPTRSMTCSPSKIFQLSFRTRSSDMP